MKHWSAFITVLFLLGSALFVGERRKVDAPVGPQALLYFVADTERELSRMPVAGSRVFFP